MSAWTNAYMPRSGERGSTSDLDDLASDQRPKPGLDGRSIEAAQRGQAVEREALAEHGRVRDQRPIGRIEAVEPGGDERMEGIGHGQLAEVADRLERAVAELEQAAVGEEHPDGLDGVEGDAVGAVDDRCGGRLRQARE